MLMNDYVSRRGQEDRYESPEWWMRPGRSYDARYGRHPNGDWMRDMPWMRETMRETPWTREYGWMRDQPYWAAGIEPMVKVIEVFAESPYSWEDATRRAVLEASQTIRGIRSIYIKDMQAIVDDDRVVGYRVNAKISFSLEESRRRR